MASRQHVILSSAIALTVAVAVASYVRSVEKAYDHGTSPVPVVVVARAIPARKVISASDVRRVTIPARLVVDGAVRDKGKTVGMISQTSMYPGEQVLSSKLLKPGPGAGMVGNIPAGRRAVTVKLDSDIGLLESIGPGDLVDVISVMPGTDGGPGRAITIVQAMPVIEVAGLSKDSGVQALTAVSQPCAVLAATPDEVQILALAQEAGSIRLTVRHPDDRGFSPIQPSSIQEIIRDSERKVGRPAVGPARTAPVEVIRMNGGSRDLPTTPKEVMWEVD